MDRKRDFYMVAGLTIVVAYANLVGPHKLVEQLFPNGEFIVVLLARSLTSQHPFRALATMERPIFASTKAPTPPALPDAHARPGAMPRLPAKAPLTKPSSL